MGSKAAKVGFILLLIGIGLTITTLEFLVNESPTEYSFFYISLAISLAIFIVGLIILIYNWNYTF